MPQFKIRKQHEDAFQPLAEQSLLAKVEQRLAKEYPESIAGMDEEVLRRQLQVGLKRANAYGITWQSSLAIYIISMFAIAPDFDQYPAVHRLLVEEKGDVNQKIKMMNIIFTDEDWDGLESFASRSTWATIDEDTQ